MARTVPEVPPFSVTVTRTGEQAVLAVTGELDLATVEAFANEVHQQLAEGPVLLDLRELSFMDSSGIRALDGLLRAVAREGWSLRVGSDLHDSVRRVLEITGMLAMLPFQEGQASAEQGK